MYSKRRGGWGGGGGGGGYLNAQDTSIPPRHVGMLWACRTCIGHGGLLCKGGPGASFVWIFFPTLHRCSCSRANK